MKKYIHVSALACATLCFSLSLTASSAHALEGSETVRAAQMRLTDLGYYAGPYDGVTGALTENAIVDFQRTNNLFISGRLTPETQTMLWQVDYATHHGGYNYYGYRTGYIDPAATTWYGGYYMPAHSAYHAAYYDPALVDWDGRWSYSHTQNIPNRFARLDITEENRGTLRHYAVTLNGRAVLFANNQPDVLRVSRTFQMDGEDTIILTAYHGDGKCAYKNYLLSMRADGSTVGPREISDCAGSFEAHVADNALVMTFPDRPAAWGVMDMWRYENGSLVRI